MYEVSPDGERRADLRSAYHFTQLIYSNRPESNQEDFTNTLQNLASYLPCDQPVEETADLDALARMKREKQNGRNR